MKIIRLFKNNLEVGSTLVVLAISLLFALLGYSEIVSRWLISLFSVVIAIRLSIGMLKDMFHGKWGVDILAVTAIVATLLVGEYWASIVIVLMMSGGRALENFANERAKSELTALVNRVPTIAHLVMQDGFTDVAVAEVQLDDHLLIKPGEVVPVDGIITEGMSTLDESSLTGESEAVAAKVGDTVMSGVVNMEAPLTIKTLRVAAESQYAQIVKLVQSAADSRAPFVRMADRFAVPFTLVSYAIAGFAWWISGEPSRFAEVLVVATPCPLLIAAPVAFISGMSRAARHGIIIKSGAFIEKLANAKTVAFDKTGTLTNGLLGIVEVVSAGEYDENDVIRYAASAEQFSVHILAESIVARSIELGLDVLDVENSREIDSDGVSCDYDGKQILVGKRMLLESHGVQIPEVAVTHTSAFVAHDGKFVGYINFADTVRDGSQTTVAKLSKLGVRRFIMLTGDNKATAESVAADVGIHDVRAECLPKDKYETIASITERPVMMVGDGINDAPVLAAADVGVAMGARGATAASESADVVIMLDDITRVARAVVIAKRTLRIALQSVWVGIALSIVLEIVAATGHIPAVVGAGLQEVVDVVVILNALRAHRG